MSPDLVAVLILLSLFGPVLWHFRSSRATHVLLYIVLASAVFRGTTHILRHSGAVEMAWTYFNPPPTDINALVDRVVEFAPNKGGDFEIELSRAAIRRLRYSDALDVCRNRSEMRAFCEAYNLRKIALRRAELAANKTCRCGPDCKCGDGDVCQCESKNKAKVK